jgi:hypothetical protein
VTQGGNFLHTWMAVAGAWIHPTAGWCFSINSHFGHLPGVHERHTSIKICGSFFALFCLIFSLAKIASKQLHSLL